MITDKSPSSITVTLILSTATRQDSGLYHCQPSGETELEAAKISVIVLQQIDYTAMLSEAGGEISLVVLSRHFSQTFLTGRTRISPLSPPPLLPPPAAASCLSEMSVHNY